MRRRVQRAMKSYDADVRLEGLRSVLSGMEEEERKRMEGEVLPFIVHLALQVHELVAESRTRLRTLRPGASDSVSVPAKVAASIVANMCVRCGAWGRQLCGS